MFNKKKLIELKEELRPLKYFCGRLILNAIVIYVAFKAALGN